MSLVFGTGDLDVAAVPAGLDQMKDVARRSLAAASDLVDVDAPPAQLRERRRAGGYTDW